jgi:hypothetical protein
MRRFSDDEGKRTGKWTYTLDGWKVSVLNQEVTQIAKGDESRFFNGPTSEQDARTYIEKGDVR